MQRAEEYDSFAELAIEIFHQTLSPSTAIMLILKYRREVLCLPDAASVFVFVDEFRQLYRECHKGNGSLYQDQDMTVLKSIGSILEHPRKHTVMISTLENTALVDNGSLDVALLALTCF